MRIDDLRHELDDIAGEVRTGGQWRRIQAVHGRVRARRRVRLAGVIGAAAVATVVSILPLLGGGAVPDGADPIFTQRPTHTDDYPAIGEFTSAPSVDGNPLSASSLAAPGVDVIEQADHLRGDPARALRTAVPRSGQRRARPQTVGAADDQRPHGRCDLVRPPRHCRGHDRHDPRMRAGGVTLPTVRDDGADQERLVEHVTLPAARSHVLRLTVAAAVETRSVTYGRLPGASAES